jgi:hypothetical protein
MPDFAAIDMPVDTFRRTEFGTPVVEEIFPELKINRPPTWPKTVMQP